MATRKCPKGQIYRKAHTLKRGRKVPGECVPGIGPLRKGDLSQFGYAKVMTLSAEQRHEALSKAVAEYGWLSIFRKLNAISVYTRRASPSSSRIFRADMMWVRRTFKGKA